MFSKVVDKVLEVCHCFIISRAKYWPTQSCRYYSKFTQIIYLLYLSFLQQIKFINLNLDVFFPSQGRLQLSAKK